MESAIYFDERLSVAVPADFRDAVRKAASRCGVTVADYARTALGERLAHDGVACPNLPVLSQDAAASGGR